MVARLILLLLLASPATLHAAPPTREPSNVAVMGVDKLRNPTHRETFSMVQYTPDPIEGFNRGSLKVTKGVLDYFIKPLAKGWRFITPTRVRQSLDNFFFNLGYLSRLFSLLLQAEFKESGVETGHFIVNTTVGLAGLFDPATRLGIPTYRQDIGLAFARWGSGPGFYFVIPALGPSSGRDGLGRLFDMVLHPLNFLPGAGLFFNMNAFTFRIDGYQALVASSKDLYFPIRALWSIQREIAVERFEIRPEDFAASDPEQSLGSLLLRVDDPRFPSRGQRRSVEMPTTGRRLPYSLWLQDEPAPLVYIIPGIGAHRGSSSPVALAEMAFARGYSTAIISSPFHWEFLINGLTPPYPGFTPSDAEDLYTALSEIHRDLGRWRPGSVTSSKLMGYSLGGIQTLFVAAAQKQRAPDALRFDRFVAINPPVEVRNAALGFDAFFDAPLSWPEEERDQRVKETIMRAFLVLQKGLEEGKPLPFSRSESEFLIGFMGRTLLNDAMAAISARGAPSLKLQEEDVEHRGPLLALINQSSFRNYADQLIIPYYLDKFGGRLDRAQITHKAGLRSQEEMLRTDDRIHIFTNANDFILGDEDLAWLREVAGERLTVFPEGGHLGNLHLKPVQEAILGALGTGEQRLAASP
jgi:ABC-type transporter lipoprotein component MlaA